MSELPSGWSAARLDEVADVRLGRQRSPKNHTGVRMRPYLRAANVTWGGLDLSDVKLMNFTPAESETYELQPGDVLVAEASGSASEVGKAASWRGEIEACCFQNTLIRVRTRHAVPEYLRYFLHLEARSGRIGHASPGVGIHHIGAARLSAWRVPLAPLNEQRRIVAAIEEQLSRLDAAEGSLADAVRKIAALRDAVMADAFEGSWPRATLGDLATIVRGVTYKKEQARSTPVEGFLPILRATNIHDRLSFDGLVYVPELVVRPEQRLQVGDVVLAASSGSSAVVGKSAFLTEEWDGSFGAFCAVIRASDAVDSAYVGAIVSSPAVRRRWSGLASGTNINNLKREHITGTEIPLPPIERQREIVAALQAQLSAVDALSASIHQAQRRNASLRRAVLERAFRGELVPQDPTDEPASVLLERIRVERQTTAASQRPRRRRATITEG